MNISVGGITSKLKSKADWVAFLLSAWNRYGDEGGIKRLFEHYTNFGSGGALDQAIYTLSNPDLLRFKLWDSPHGYTGLFKAGVFAYIAAEAGILDKKWKKTIEKVLVGSGVAALTLGGSGGFPDPSEGGSKTGGNSPSWRYRG